MSRVAAEFNKQRQRLRQVLATAANGGSVVNTKDLLLACRLAKLDVGGDHEGHHFDVDRFVQANYISARDCYGVPRQVNWKGFASSIQYPQLHLPGEFPGELPKTKLQKLQLKVDGEQVDCLDVFRFQNKYLRLDTYRSE